MFFPHLKKCFEFFCLFYVLTFKHCRSLPPAPEQPGTLTFIHSNGSNQTAPSHTVIVTRGKKVDAPPWGGGGEKAVHSSAFQSKMAMSPAACKAPFLFYKKAEPPVVKMWTH